MKLAIRPIASSSASGGKLPHGGYCVNIPAPRAIETWPGGPAIAGATAGDCGIPGGTVEGGGTGEMTAGGGDEGIDEASGDVPVAGGGNAGISSVNACAPCAGPIDAVRKLTDCRTRSASTCDPTR